MTSDTETCSCFPILSNQDADRRLLPTEKENRVKCQLERCLELFECNAKCENLDISELISKNSKLQGKDDCSRIEADGIPLAEVLREARQVPGRRAR